MHISLSSNVTAFVFRLNKNLIWFDATRAFYVAKEQCINGSAFILGVSRNTGRKRNQQKRKVESNKRKRDKKFDCTLTERKYTIKSIRLFLPIVWPRSLKSYCGEEYPIVFLVFFIFWLSIRFVCLSNSRDWFRIFWDHWFVFKKQMLKLYYLICSIPKRCLLVIFNWEMILMVEGGII